jgi:queuosine precursor transporter
MTSGRFLPAVSAVFVTCLIVSNVIAVKIGAFGPWYLPVAVIVFPVAYIFGDILTEVYGYARARQVIWIGFACNALAVGAIAVGGWIPAAPYWTAGEFDTPQAAQRAYQAVLGFTPRLLVASFLAYVVGEFVNAFVLAKIKLATRGRWLWLRTIGSTLAGELLDSAIFLSVAFVGVLPAASLVPLVVTQWLFKSGYEALATPLTYAVVAALKRAEKLDVFDTDTNFNPLALLDRRP